MADSVVLVVRQTVRRRQDPLLVDQRPSADVLFGSASAKAAHVGEPLPRRRDSALRQCPSCASPATAPTVPRSSVRLGWTGRRPRRSRRGRRTLAAVRAARLGHPASRTPLPAETGRTVFGGAEGRRKIPRFLGRGGRRTDCRRRGLERQDVADARNDEFRTVNGGRRLRRVQQEAEPRAQKQAPHVDRTQTASTVEANTLFFVRCKERTQCRSRESVNDHEVVADATFYLDDPVSASCLRDLPGRVSPPLFGSHSTPSFVQCVARSPTGQDASWDGRIVLHSTALVLVRGSVSLVRT